MELRSVDPARNRQRRYALSIQYRVDGGAELVIAWGRIGQRARVRVESFESVIDLRRRYAALLARRRRHDYQQVAPTAVQSASPYIRALATSFTIDRTTRFTPMRQTNGHVGIFDGQRHGYLVRDIDLAAAAFLAAKLNAAPVADPEHTVEVLIRQAA